MYQVECNTGNIEKINTGNIEKINTGDIEKINNFECHFCAQVFSRDVDMKTHILSHIKEEPLQSIDEPELSIEKIQPIHELENLLAESIKQEPVEEGDDYYNTNVINFKCSICGNEFRHRGHYARHLIRHSKQEDNYFSTFRKKIGSSSQKRVPVLAVRSRNKKYKCLICGSQYSYQGHYFRHMLKHNFKPIPPEGETATISKSEPFPENVKCEINETEITSISESEPVPKNYVKCGRKRRSIENVGFHERYPCFKCSKTFSMKSILTRHALIHTGLKPFKCNMCGMSCARRDNLKLHIAICRKRRKPYRCKVCNENCKSSGMLKQHMIIHVGEKDIDPEYFSAHRKIVPGRKVDLLKRRGKLNYIPEKIEKLDCTQERQAQVNSIPERTDELKLDCTPARQGKLDCTSDSPKNWCIRKEELDFTTDRPKIAKLAKSMKHEESKDLMEAEAISYEDHPYKDSIVIWEDSNKISVSVKHLVAQMKKQRVTCTVCDLQFYHQGRLKVHMKLHTGESAIDGNSPTNQKSIEVHDRATSSGRASSTVQERERLCNTKDLKNVASTSAESGKLNEITNCSQTISSVTQKSVIRHEKTDCIKIISSTTEENVRLSDDQSSRKDNVLKMTEVEKPQGKANSGKSVSSTTLNQRKFVCGLCGQRFKHGGFYRRHLRWHETKATCQKKADDKKSVDAYYGTQVKVSGIKATNEESDVDVEGVEELQTELSKDAVIDVSPQKDGSIINCSTDEQHNQVTESTVKCTECNREFKRKNHLVLHMIKTHRKFYKKKKPQKPHTRKRNSHFQFKCTDCGRAFKRRAHLVLHSRLHKPESHGFSISDIKEEVAVTDPEEPQNVTDSEEPQNANDPEEPQNDLSQDMDQCSTDPGEPQNDLSQDMDQCSTDPGEPQNDLSQDMQQCSMCDCQYTNGGNLYLHMKKSHGVKFGDVKVLKTKKEETEASSSFDESQNELPQAIRKCPDCDREFKKEYHLAVHMKGIHNKEYGGKKIYKLGVKHKCSVCNRLFKHSGYLTLHMRKHMPKFTVEESPDFEMKGAASNSSEEKVSNGAAVEMIKEETVADCSVEVTDHNVVQRKFRCYKCGLEFKRRGHLLLHMRQHERRRFNKIGKKKKYLCRTKLKELGSKNYEYFLGEDAFMTSYSQKKPQQGTEDTDAQKFRYRCPVCPKGFRFPGGIGRHLVVHSSERPFTCKECGKACKREDNLRLHMKVCFKRRGKTFEYHKRKVENGSEKKFLPVKPLKVLVCRICWEPFHRNNLFMKHMIQHRKEDFLKLGYWNATGPEALYQDDRYSPIIFSNDSTSPVRLKSGLRVSLPKLELGTEKTFQVTKHGRGYTINSDQNVEPVIKKEWIECVRCGGDMELNYTAEGEPVTTECKTCREIFVRQSGGNGDTSTNETFEVELQSSEQRVNSVFNSQAIIQKTESHMINKQDFKPVVDMKDLKSFRKPDVANRLKIHVCIFCNKVYKKIDLAKHVYQHLTGKAVDYKDPCNAQEHAEKQMVPDDLDTKCSVCGIAFGSCDNLEEVVEQHMKNHIIEGSVAWLCNESEGSHRESKDIDCFARKFEQHPGQTDKLQSCINSTDMIPIIGKHKISYTCNECGKVYLTKIDIRKHVVEHMEQKKIFCYKCGKGFENSEEINEHIKTHISKPHTHDKCVKCGICFEKVIRPGCSPRKLLCMKCQDYFKKSLIRPLMKYKEKNKKWSYPMYCKLCNRKCIGMQGLNVHMVYHVRRKHNLKNLHNLMNVNSVGTYDNETVKIENCANGVETSSAGQPITKTNKVKNAEVTNADSGTSLDSITEKNAQKYSTGLENNTIKNINSPPEEIRGTFLTNGLLKSALLQPSSEIKSVQNWPGVLPVMTNQALHENNFVQIRPNTVRELKILPKIAGVNACINPSNAVVNGTSGVNLPQNIARSEIGAQPRSWMNMKTGVHEFQGNAGTLPFVNCNADTLPVVKYNVDALPVVKYNGESLPVVKYITFPSSSSLTKSERPVKIMAKPPRPVTFAQNNTSFSLSPTFVPNFNTAESSSNTIKYSFTTSMNGNSSVANVGASLKPIAGKICCDPSQTERILKFGSKPVTVVNNPEKTFDLTDVANVKNTSQTVPINIKSGNTQGEISKALMQIDRVLFYPHTVQNNISPALSSVNTTNWIINAPPSTVGKNISSSNNGSFSYDSPNPNSANCNLTVSSQATGVQPVTCKAKDNLNDIPSPEKGRRKVDGFSTQKGKRKNKIDVPPPNKKKKSKIIGLPVGPISGPSTNTVSSNNTVVSSTVKNFSPIFNAEDEYDQALWELGKSVQSENSQEGDTDLAELSVEDFALWETMSKDVPNDLLENLWVKEKVPDENGDVP